ncbi:hypothetical protein [Embleya sp. NPDC050493]|uniref:hypothetical protein n=1 Tax=Embleya sp. NPDC050493 TaxID=3363989 RepID=UPI0037B03A9C
MPPRARLAVAAAGGHANVAAKALATVLQEVADCALVPSGVAFNDKLNRAAYTAGGLVAAGHLDASDAERLLLEAAERARPGHRRRSLSTIRASMTAGRARPLNPEPRSPPVSGIPPSRFDAAAAAARILADQGTRRSSPPRTPDPPTTAESRARAGRAIHTAGMRGVPAVIWTQP